jgi:hypothetical protein
MAAITAFVMLILGGAGSGSGNVTFKRVWGATGTCLNHQYVLNDIRDVPNVSLSNPGYDRLPGICRFMALGDGKPPWLSRKQEGGLMVAGAGSEYIGMSQHNTPPAWIVKVGEASNEA